MHAPLVLNLAPAGMVPTRAMSASVPLQPAEIVADVLSAAALGVTIVHLHARAEVLDLPGDLRPDMASLTMSSLSFSRQASVNAPATTAGLVERVHRLADAVGRTIMAPNDARARLGLRPPG